MSDLLKAGSDWLYDRMAAHAAASITYRRGQAELSITATVAAERTEVVEEEGTTYRRDRRDFVILQASLGALFPPASGDEILFAGKSYLVLPRGPDEDVWRWSDRYHKAVRVFAKSRSA